MTQLLSFYEVNKCFCVPIIEIFLNEIKVKQSTVIDIKIAFNRKIKVAQCFIFECPQEVKR